MWKTSTGICFTTAYAGEKIDVNQLLTSGHGMPVSSKVGLGNNYSSCPTSP